MENYFLQKTLINLFNIPNHKIDTSKFNNLLHGDIVTEFEQNFAKYVGAKYAVSFNSATSAIFLLFSLLKQRQNKALKYNYGYAIFSDSISIPSILPPVVANAIINSNFKIDFVDFINWVGHSYKLHQSDYFDIIDSAQRVDKNQYKNRHSDSDLMIFSFYPTKPVSGCDGGMIVSNNPILLNELRILALNGMNFSQNNWDRKQECIGHKMYMNSIQAYIANENLKKLDEKKAKLKKIRDFYNEEFSLDNKSDHLYRIEVKDNKKFLELMKNKGIVCGIHYSALHKNKLFLKHTYIKPSKRDLGFSEMISKKTVSIPFHEKLTISQQKYIVRCVKSAK